MSHEHAWLDPADETRSSRRLWGVWLALQAEFLCRPCHAVELLRRSGDPARALARAGVAPARGPGLDATLARLRRCGAVGVPLGSPAYPEPLAWLEDAAPLLLLRGDPRALAGLCVAIVGARAPTIYGLDQARRLAGDLARLGIAVVSGLARGIDAAAHEGALRAGGRTLAVQGCGPDRVYPAGHQGLARRIAASGAVISEFPPGTPPLPQHFPLRNRLISGIARAVVVVEARERSGSLITARHALDQGREVLAVPGPVCAPTSAGSNRLLRDGAWPVLDVDDVLRSLGLPPPASLPPGSGAPPSHSRPQGGPPPLAERIRAELRVGPFTRDELSRRLGCASAELDAALVDLELEGDLSECRDGRLHARR